MNNANNQISSECQSNQTNAFRQIFISYFAGFGSSQQSSFSFRLSNSPTVDQYPFTQYPWIYNTGNTRHESSMNYIFLLVEEQSDGMDDIFVERMLWIAICCGFG